MLFRRFSHLVLLLKSTLEFDLLFNLGFLFGLVGVTIALKEAHQTVRPFMRVLGDWWKNVAGLREPSKCINVFTDV